MPKGWNDAGDPTKSEFPQWDQDVYEVSGIVGFISTDQQSLPVFKPGKFSDKLIAQVNLKIEDDDVTGPPYSGTRAQIVLLLKALGVNVEGLPPGETTAFLLEAKKRSESSQKSVKAFMTKPREDDRQRWVARIEGTLPPENLYGLRYVKARSPDNSEPIHFKEIGTFDNKRGGTFTPVGVYVVLEIVGEVSYEQGMIPSAYNGYEFQQQIRNPFAAPEDRGSGEVRPNMQVTQAGGTPRVVKEFKGFCAAFCPDVYEHDWQNDPLKSNLGIPEVDYPFAVVDDYAKKANIIAVGRLTFSDKGFPQLDFAELTPSDVSAPPETATPPSVPELLPLLDLVEQLAKVVEPVITGKVFKQSAASSNEIGFTPEGLEWCKKHIAPVWDRVKGLPTTRLFDRLNKEQVLALDSALRTEYHKYLVVEEESAGF
jgi:hypothetical protein